MVKQYKITIKVEEVQEPVELKDLAVKILEKTTVTAELADILACWEYEVDLIEGYWFNEQFDLLKEKLTLNDLCKLHQGKLFNNGKYVGDENIIIRDIGNGLVLLTFDEYVNEIKSLIKEDTYYNWALKLLLEML